MYLHAPVVWRDQRARHIASRHSLSIFFAFILPLREWISTAYRLPVATKVASDRLRDDGSRSSMSCLCVYGCCCVQITFFTFLPLLVCVAYASSFRPHVHTQMDGYIYWVHRCRLTRDSTLCYTRVHADSLHMINIWRVAEEMKENVRRGAYGTSEK